MVTVAALAGPAIVAGATPAAAQGEPTDVTAPETPVIELLTEEPWAGQPVTLRFTSSDLDSGLEGFWYGINEEVKREYVAAPAGPGELGIAEVTFTAPPQWGRVFVYVWARDVAGNSSNRAYHDFMVQTDPPPPPPPRIAVAAWSLNGDTQDDLGNHHLTLTGTEGVDYDWVTDAFCFPWSALALTGSGTGYATTDSTLIDTDQAFSVAAWVRLDPAGSGDRTVLSQSGPVQPVMSLQVTADGGWRFAVPHQNPLRPGGVVESAPGIATPGLWHHVTGVYDPDAGELLLYVNGELAASGQTAATPWRARGPFTLGAASTTRGTISQPMAGTLDLVEVWASPLDATYIGIIGGMGGKLVPCF